MATSDTETDDGYDIPGFGHIVEVDPPKGEETKAAAPALPAVPEVDTEDDGAPMADPEPAHNADADSPDEEVKAEAEPEAPKVSAPSVSYDQVARIDDEIAALQAEARELAAEAIDTDPLAYGTDAEYQRALAANAAREREMARLKGRYDRLQAVKAQARTSSWEAQKAAAATKFKDFDVVMRQAAFAPTPAMAEAIIATPKGAEIAYHLSKNPKLGAEISTLPPIQAAIAIGRIESQLSAVQTPPKKITQAPPPPPVTTGGRASVQRSSVEQSSIGDLKRALREAY